MANAKESTILYYLYLIKCFSHLVIGWWSCWHSGCLGQGAGACRTLMRGFPCASPLPCQGITYCAGALGVADARDTLLYALCAHTLTNPAEELGPGGTVPILGEPERNANG